jgi:hypothetical protein
MLLPFGAFAQFEGTLQMATEAKATQETAQVEWQVKDGKHLMAFQSESEGNKMNYSLLIKEGEDKFWFLSKEPSKAAYAVPMTVLDKRDLGLPLNSVLKPGEKTRKIAGYECQHYRIISTQVTVDCWVATDTGIAPSDFPPFMRNGALMGILRLNGVQGVPLKFEVRDIAEELLNSQTIQKITPKKLTDNTFEVPSDYVKNPGNQ